MKLWNNINWPAAKAGRALKLKIEDDFWRRWQEQDALKEKGAAVHLAQADRASIYALMVWSDDGGPGGLIQWSSREQAGHSVN